MKTYFFRSWKIIALGVALCLLQLFLGVNAQLYKGRVLDQAIAQQDGLALTILILILLSAGSVAVSYLHLACRSRFEQKITKMLRDDLFRSLLRHSHVDFGRLDRGEVLALYTKQIRVVEREFLFMLAWLAGMLLEIIFVVMTLLFLNPLLGILSALIFTVPMLLPKFSERKLTAASTVRLEKMQAHLARFNSWLKGFELIKNYAIEDEIERQFADSNGELLDSERRAEKTFAKTNGWSFIGTMGAQACLVIIAGVMVFRGSISAGHFIAVMGLVSMLKAPIYWVAKLVQNIIATKPVRKSLLEFITYQGPAEQHSCRIYPDHPPAIAVRQLQFGYGEETLLRGVNMTFQPGRRYLVTGESGCGKSSLINILLGNLVPDDGGILIGGQPLATIGNLRDLFSVARQDAVLFDDTLLNNLTLFDETVGREQIFQVLKSLGLERLASEDGLQMNVNASGANLSGGEKKRLSLARALLRQAPILVLDEPLANIDAANVSQIEDLLLGTNGQTVIIVSHQFSRAKLAGFDAIYKMERGTVYETLLDQA